MQNPKKYDEETKNTDHTIHTRDDALEQDLFFSKQVFIWNRLEQVLVDRFSCSGETVSVETETGRVEQEQCCKLRSRSRLVVPAVSFSFARSGCANGCSAAPGGAGADN